MLITLKHTTSGQIASALLRHRRAQGASGLVFTLVVVAEERHYARVLEACIEAGREHPSRILIVVRGRSTKSVLDAEILSGEGVPGSVITLRMSGELADHGESVILPLLLPDSPVVVWWPNSSPDKPADDPIGALATRRITDASGARNPLEALRIRARYHSPGDTDLTWTRLTPWRALLAAAVDQYPSRILEATVEAARDNAPAELMSAWLQGRLDVPVSRKNTRGPGITGVRLVTPAGDISVIRDEEGVMAEYRVPGQPKRTVALKRRDINQLITEELRRMDADDIFEDATEVLLKRHRAALRQATAKQPAAPARKRKAHEAPPAETPPPGPDPA